LLTAGKVNKKATGEDNSMLAQQLRSVYASDRIDAVMKLTTRPNLSDADLKMLQLALREDPNPNVRLTILNTLRPLAKQKNVQEVLISSLNQQGDVLVQSSIIDMLVDAKSKQAIPQMIALLDDKDTDVMVQNKIKGGIESFLN
jgi:HEAT repeat protein